MPPSAAMHTWLWEKDSSFFLSPEACGLELVFCSCFFFPFFVVKYWASCRGSPQVSGVSLLVHYISESSTKGRTNAKQGHLTSSLSDPQSASVTLRAQFWEILIQVFLVQYLLLEPLLRTRLCAMHMVYENGWERHGRFPHGDLAMEVSGCGIINIHTKKWSRDLVSAREIT